MLLLKNKADIIHDLIKIYTTVSQQSNITQDIAKCKVTINDILKRKDKLLDLSIIGRLSGDEFERRNNSFNIEIDTLKVKTNELEEQEQVNREIELSIIGI